MDFVDLQFMTDDIEIQTLCKKYWDMDGEGNFLYTVKSLSENYGQKSHTLSKIIKENCHAHSQSLFCNNCSTPFIYSSRADFKSTHRNNWICENCRIEENEKELQKQKNRDLKRKSIIQST